MRIRRRAFPVLIAGALAMSACTTSGSDAGGSDRPVAGGIGERAVDPLGDAGADDVVWQQFEGGGRFSPAGSDVPEVTIYGDGTIYVARTVRGVREVRRGSVDLDELRGLLDDAADSGLFVPDADYGDPETPSLDQLDVTARVDGTLRTTSVIAPGIEDTELRPADRLSEEQIARRDELEGLVLQARALASGLTAWTPDRIRAVAGIPGPGEELTDPELRSELAPQPWPGPPFDAFPETGPEGGPSCLVVEGPDAATVDRAAAGNPDGFWSDGDEVWPIVVTPLLPGQEGCGPS